jgi:hypothetical protein
MEEHAICHNVKPKECGDWFRQGIVEEFIHREARKMQTQGQTATRNEGAANFRERSWDVHIGERNRRDYPVKTRFLEWQAFTGSQQVGSFGESHPGDFQTPEVNVKPNDLIRGIDAVRSQLPPRSAT